MLAAKCPRCKKIPEYSHPTEDVYQLHCDHTVVQDFSSHELIARWNRSMTALLCRMRGRGLNAKYEKRKIHAT